MVDAKMEAIRIVTRCTSRDQFVAMFSRYCTPTSCFIPSSDSRPVGTATVFSVRLADGGLLLRGEGVVLDAWSHGDHRFKRPGVHLGIHRLDDECAELFELLGHPRSTAIPIPPKTQLQMLLATQPSVVSELETPTIEMPPLALPEEPRVPHSPFVLPANPLTEMTDDLLSAFVDCNLVSEDVAAPVLLENPTDTTIPTEIPYEPTLKTRDAIPTILGVAPLKPQVFAAPQPVITELMDRVESPRVGINEVDTGGVAITYAAAPHAAPAPRRPTPRRNTPQRPEPRLAPISRPRQRLRLSALGAAPITQIVRGPAQSVGRLRRRLARALRRWWLPATVATTIVATTVTAALVISI